MGAGGRVGWGLDAKVRCNVSASDALVSGTADTPEHGRKATLQAQGSVIAGGIGKRRNSINCMPDAAQGSKTPAVVALLQRRVREGPEVRGRGGYVSLR